MDLISSLFSRTFVTRPIASISILIFAVLSATQISFLPQWPVHPMDVLPLLPRQVSSSILNYLKAPADIIPKFVGYASSESTLQWQGSCFKDSSISLEFHNKSKSEFGGGTLHVKVLQPQSLTCLDVYIFATPYHVTGDYYFKRGKHTFEFDKWENKAEYEYVKKQGVAIFLWQAGFKNVVTELLKWYPLYQDSEKGEQANIDFLKTNMGTTFNLRPKASWVSNINLDDIQSGDFLAVSKIRGSAGLFETIEKWITGSDAGHAAVCLRDPQGKLWVGESGRTNDKGLEIVEVLPWEKFWEYELTEDPATPHIALLPLHPDVRARFDEAAAWNYAVSANNTPYGDHNLIFSWIDTVKDNYPPPLGPEMVSAAMTIFDILKPESGIYWNEALNKRLGTQNLTLAEVLVELQKRGSSFGELLTVPEQDDWIYSDGKSATCVAFSVLVYKHAGVFGSLTDSIQATEFTVRDGYALKFYEDDPTRLPKWCNEGDSVKLPFCQVLGKYRMELRGYNTEKPYAKMNEKCPSLPPNYERPSNC